MRSYIDRRQRHFVVAAVVLCHLLVWTGCRSSRAAADEPEVGRALELITPGLVRAHVRFLSHDLLRGRDTGDEGFEIAREYVVAQFARIGLEPIDGTSYLQPFDLIEASQDRGSELQLGGMLISEPDAHFMPSWLQPETAWEGEGVYVGYGLVTNGRHDYTSENVSGKAVFMLSGAPPQWNEARETARAAAAKAEAALREGAAMIVELAAPLSRDGNDASTARPSAPRRVYALADGTTNRIRPHVVVTAAAASSRIATLWGLDPQTIQTVADAGTGQVRSVGHVRIKRKHDTRRVTSWNVIGLVRGADAAHRDESVVFSSHLDHIGIGPADAHGDTINNGAHDNAIGVARLLAAAEAMVRLKPRRTIIFAAMGAEERGELGSWFYVRHPILAIEKTVANVNQDGGREGSAPSDIIDNAADLSDLHGIVRDVLLPHGVTLVSTDPAARDQVGFSSDHYSFLLAGVPAVDFKDGYSINGNSDIGVRERLSYLKTRRHTPADNFDEQTFTLQSGAEMAKRSVWLAWHLASMEGMPALRRESVMWRERAKPAQPWYFGPTAGF